MSASESSKKQLSRRGLLKLFAATPAAAVAVAKLTESEVEEQVEELVKEPPLVVGPAIQPQWDPPLDEPMESVTNKIQEPLPTTGGDIEDQIIGLLEDDRDPEAVALARKELNMPQWGDPPPSPVRSRE